MPVEVSRPGPGDAEEFVSSVLASRELHHPWIDPPDSPARYIAYLERLERDDHAGFLVRHVDCGGLVGFVNANNIVRGAFRSAALGYAAFSSHAGRGLMREGLSAVVTACFDELGLHRVEANVQPTNAFSRRLVRSLGFELEGVSKRFLFIDGEWRDHERWALRVEQWRR